MAFFHFAEGFFPFIQPIDATDHWVQIDLTRGEQPEHAFPSGIGVAKGTLQGDGLADQRIEAEIERLRSPADFCNATIGAHQLHRLFERTADARAVDDQIGAKAVAQ